MLVSAVTAFFSIIWKPRERTHSLTFLILRARAHTVMIAGWRKIYGGWEKRGKSSLGEGNVPVLVKAILAKEIIIIMKINYNY